MRTIARAHILILIVALAVAVLRPACGLAADPGEASIQRAVAFLAADVPKWEGENRCFSCHNNGDAARALMWASDSGKLPDRKPLDETLTFLAAPETWDANGPDGPFKDLKLQRLQFAVALAEAHATGVLENFDAQNKAAALVAEFQSPDGYWDTDAPGTIGSPITYGRVLATALAQKMLARTTDDYSEQVDKAQRWLEKNEPQNVLDAAATILGLTANHSVAAHARRQQCQELIKQGQSSDGGWGPFVNSPPAVFDTAVVVLALSVQTGNTYAEAIQAGREFLLAQQEPDGGWPATTRPPGVDSYAQRMSTSAWALQAVLASKRDKSIQND
jgi:HPt (histidine-containing phosphotransfer) domain-containing protein